MSRSRHNHSCQGAKTFVVAIVAKKEKLEFVCFAIIFLFRHPLALSLPNRRPFLFFMLIIHPKDINCESKASINFSSFLFHIAVCNWKILVSDSCLKGKSWLREEKGDEVLSSNNWFESRTKEKSKRGRKEWMTTRKQFRWSMDFYLYVSVSSVSAIRNVSMK